MTITVAINNTEVLSDKKFPLKEFTYQLTEDGKTTEKKSEIYYRPDAVALLLYDEERQMFLLTRQFRLGAYLNGTPTGYMTEACAGLIDEGESPENTACREAMEELGYQIDQLEKVAVAYSSVGGITEKVHLFMALYTPDLKTEKGGGLESEGESVEQLEISFAEAREKLRDGGFNDMKTILLMQHYFLSRS